METTCDNLDCHVSHPCWSCIPHEERVKRARRALGFMLVFSGLFWLWLLVFLLHV